MMTLTEVYGKMWELFIKEQFKGKKVTYTEKTAIALLDRFEGFLSKYDMQYAQ